MKTSELTGAALDWAVARCEDTITADGYFLVDQMRRPHPAFYSTDWSQGGPIIEREGISIDFDGSVWWAECNSNDYHNRQSGGAPLIAACRCYVASKLGDEVEIPAELL